MLWILASWFAGFGLIIQSINDSKVDFGSGIATSAAEFRITAGSSP